MARRSGGVGHCSWFVAHPEDRVVELSEPRSSGVRAFQNMLVRSTRALSIPLKMSPPAHGVEKLASARVPRDPRMQRMPEELISVLTRFDREVVLPDIERIVTDAIAGVDSRVSRLRDETLSHFDAVYKRFDRLEVEY